MSVVEVLSAFAVPGDGGVFSVRFGGQDADDLAGRDVSAGGAVGELGGGAQRHHQEGGVTVELDEVARRDGPVEREPCAEPGHQDDEHSRQEHLGGIEGGLDTGDPDPDNADPL